jgi:hypothetical protein
MQGELARAFEKAASRGQPLLVYGPWVEAQAVTDAVQGLVPDRKVVAVDCTRECPSEAELELRFSEGLAKGKVLHVALGQSLPGPVWSALLTVVSDGRLPGLDANAKPQGQLVVSAGVKWLTELSPKLREYFPISVGDVHV